MPSFSDFFPLIDLIKDFFSNKPKDNVIYFKTAVACFLYLIMISLIFTWVFHKDGHDDNVLIPISGYENICIHMDVAPVTYLLPVIYTGIAYLFIKFHLNDIKNNSDNIFRVILNILNLISVIFFANVFATQPDEKKPITVLIHTAPFMLLIFTLTLFQSYFIFKMQGVLPKILAICYIAMGIYKISYTCYYMLHWFINNKKYNPEKKKFGDLDSETYKKIFIPDKNLKKKKPWEMIALVIDKIWVFLAILLSYLFPNFA